MELSLGRLSSLHVFDDNLCFMGVFADGFWMNPRMNFLLSKGTTGRFHHFKNPEIYFYIYLQALSIAGSFVPPQEAHDIQSRPK